MINLRKIAEAQPGYVRQHRKQFGTTIRSSIYADTGYVQVWKRSIIA